MEDFDPEKLIDLMKKNGEWDDEDDNIYGKEALRQGLKPKDGADSSDSEAEDREFQEKERLYKEQKRKAKMMPPGFNPEMLKQMMPQMEEEDEAAGLKIPKEIGEDEDFLFENFLKKGEY